MNVCRLARRVLACTLITATALTHAFQLAPMGSRFEAKLTNETPSWLATVAGKVGVLLKEPVHEEITQLALGCPADPQRLPEDRSCLGGDHGFANHFLVYGVRWNDLPPFRLYSSEGSACRRLAGVGAACNADQTVRFSTQPECWYCLFMQGQRLAEAKTIDGCRKGKGISRGNLLTRSHFGDLQFLHSMASGDHVAPQETQARILDWFEFTWKVARREIGPDTQLKSIRIPAIQRHFGCSEWTVADLYILGRNDLLRPKLPEIALGSALHTLQDSFAGGHTTRESSAPEGLCEGTNTQRIPRVIEFHSYAGQDGHKHDARDTREAMTEPAPSPWPLAVQASRQIADLHQAAAPWSEVKAHLQCMFDLAPEPRFSSPGIPYSKTP